jgi:hypothetical protein
VSALDPYTTAAMEQAREMSGLRASNRALAAELATAREDLTHERAAAESMRRNRDEIHARFVAVERERFDAAVRDLATATADLIRERYVMTRIASALGARCTGDLAADVERLVGVLDRYADRGDAARAEAAAHLAALRNLRDGLNRLGLAVIAGDAIDGANAYLASIDGAGPNASKILNGSPAPDPRLAGFRVGDAIEVRQPVVPAKVAVRDPISGMLAYVPVCGAVWYPGRPCSLPMGHGEGHCHSAPEGATCWPREDATPAAPEERPHAVGDRWERERWDHPGVRVLVVSRVAVYEDGSSLLFFADDQPAKSAGEMIIEGRRRLPPAPVALGEVTHEGTRYAVGDRWRFDDDDAQTATVTAVYPPEPERGWFEPRISLGEKPPAHLGWWLGQGWAPTPAAPTFAVGQRVRTTRTVGRFAPGSILRIVDRDFDPLLGDVYIVGNGGPPVRAMTGEIEPAAAEVTP